MARKKSPDRIFENVDDLSWQKFGKDVTPLDGGQEYALETDVAAHAGGDEEKARLLASLLLHATEKRKPQHERYCMDGDNADGPAKE